MRSGKDPTVPLGRPLPGGQVEIGAEDLAKLGRLVLDRGRWGEEQVVPEARLKEMLPPWRQRGPHAYDTGRPRGRCFSRSSADGRQPGGPRSIRNVTLILSSSTDACRGTPW